MKSFWISCVVLELVLLLALAGSSPVVAAKRQRLEPQDLTNFVLSPDYSQWLVGPISRMASDSEIRRYLSLKSDEEAVSFIEEFWVRRGGEAVFPKMGKKRIFEERAEEADRQFSEGTYMGRRTDRGTVYVLYGPPEEVRYELSPRQSGETIEVWSYPKDAEEGLDDQEPDRLYSFVKQGDRTVLYRGPFRRQVSRTPTRPPN